MSNEEFVQSLRQIADFFEQHPEVPLPNDTFHILCLNTPEEIAPIVKMAEEEIVEWEMWITD